MSNVKASHQQQRSHRHNNGGSGSLSNSYNSYKSSISPKIGSVSNGSQHNHRQPQHSQRRMNPHGHQSHQHQLHQHQPHPPQQPPPHSFKPSHLQHSGRNHIRNKSKSQSPHHHSYGHSNRNYNNNHNHSTNNNYHSHSHNHQHHSHSHSQQNDELPSVKHQHQGHTLNNHAPNRHGHGHGHNLHSRRLNQNRASKPIRIHSHLDNNYNQHKTQRSKRRFLGDTSKNSSGSPLNIPQQPVSARNTHQQAMMSTNPKSYIKAFGTAPSSEQTKRLNRNNFDVDMNSKDKSLPTLSGRSIGVKSKLNRRKFHPPHYHPPHGSILSGNAGNISNRDLGGFNHGHNNNKFRFGKYRSNKRGHQPLLGGNHKNKLATNPNDMNNHQNTRGNRFRRAGGTFLAA